jgi:hypothetical protein
MLHETCRCSFLQPAPAANPGTPYASPGHSGNQTFYVPHNVYCFRTGMQIPETKQLHIISPFSYYILQI